ncbi:MAG: DNA polymerase III subunit delta' [Pseudomonadota bacterium]
MSDGEPTPEIDHLTDVLHPRENTALFGHQAASRDLANAFASGRIHHAWMLCGREGIGKATLAYRLARHILSAPLEAGAGAGLFGDASPDAAPDDDPLASDPMAPASRQVMALSHPGLLVLRRQWDAKRKKFGTMIAVDEVRKLRSFLGLSASDGGWRIVIVDRAEEMNVNAANALLKSLEEPPQRCLFLLIAAEPGRLPITIHSRCRRLTLNPLDAGEMQAAIEHVGNHSDVSLPDTVDWETLHRLAQGSVRRALVLTGEDGLTLYDELVQLLGVLPHLDWPRVHGMAESLALVARETRYNLMLDLLQDVLARMIRLATVEGADDRSDAEAAIARRVVAEGNLAQWSCVWERLARERAEVRLLNLDRQNFILSVFQWIEAAARNSARAA